VRPTVRLHQVTYAVDDNGFSVPIPAPDEGVNRGAHIVAFDWSVSGQVTVTWMRPA
jgi:hypothetical protein